MFHVLECCFGMAYSFLDFRSVFLTYNGSVHKYFSCRYLSHSCSTYINFAFKRALFLYNKLFLFTCCTVLPAHFLSPIFFHVACSLQTVVLLTISMKIIHNLDACFSQCCVQDVRIILGHSSPHPQPFQFSRNNIFDICFV